MCNNKQQTILSTFFFLPVGCCCCRCCIQKFLSNNPILFASCNLFFTQFYISLINSKKKEEEILTVRVTDNDKWLRNVIDAEDRVNYRTFTLKIQSSFWQMANKFKINFIYFLRWNEAKRDGKSREKKNVIKSKSLNHLNFTHFHSFLHQLGFLFSDPLNSKQISSKVWF